MIKYIALALVLPLAAAAWAARPATGGARALSLALGSALGGFLLGLAPWLAWLGPSGVTELLDVQRDVSTGYTLLGVSSLAPGLAYLGQGTRWTLLTLSALIVLAGIGAASIRSWTAPMRALTIGWLVAAVLGYAAHAAGWPLPRGGSQQIAEALGSLLRSLGGSVVTGVRIGALKEIESDGPILFDTSPGEMLRIAGGEPLRLRQEDIRIKGCAIECRINAEDPANDFMPNPGTVDGLMVPGGPGVRFDTMLYPGYAITPFYDSLLGKLIVWDESRPSALSRLGRALAELEISGIKTTQPLHQALVADKAVQTASFHTTFLEHWLASRPPGLVHYEELASK